MRKAKRIRVKNMKLTKLSLKCYKIPAEAINIMNHKKEINKSKLEKRKLNKKLKKKRKNVSRIYIMAQHVPFSFFLRNKQVIFTLYFQFFLFLSIFHFDIIISQFISKVEISMIHHGSKLLLQNHKPHFCKCVVFIFQFSI